MFQWERRTSEYLLLNVLSKPFSFSYIFYDRQEKGRFLIRVTVDDTFILKIGLICNAL